MTAQRREERLQDTAISIQAYSQEALDVQGVRNIDDIARLTPGITFSRNATSENYNGESTDIAIRGVQSDAGASTTGIYIDDTPIQSRHLSYGTLNAYPALFDLERVEVLRGPQGTLFGAGSEGGTVRFITPQPGLRDYSAYTRTEATFTEHGTPSYEASVAAGGPIKTDTLGLRASVSYRKDGGWVDRVNGDTGASVEPNSNWQETYVFRGALKYAPTEKLTISPSIYIQELYVNDTGFYWNTLSNPSGGVFRNGNPTNNKSTDPFFLPAVKIEWDLGAATLISNTSYFARNQHARVDYTKIDRIILTGDPYTKATQPGLAYFTDTQNNFVQELRLQSTAADSRLKWIAGLFYGRQRENTTNYLYEPTLTQDVLDWAGYDVGPMLPGGFLYRQAPFQAIDKQIALFGQVDYELLKGVTLTAGLRASHTELLGDIFYEYPEQILGPPVQTHTSSSEHPVTPRIGFSYRPNADTLIYTSSAKGYRIGGINPGLPGLCNDGLNSIGYPNGVPQKYNSDSLWSHEIGVKSDLWDRRVQIAASLYYIQWKGIQQSIYVPSCGFSFTANLGKVISKGGDIDARARLTNALTVGLSVGYSNAAYADTVSGTDANIVSAGNHLPESPWTISSSAEYLFRSIGETRPYLHLDYQIATAQRTDTDVRDPRNASYDPSIPFFPAAKSMTARAGFRLGGFDVSVFGQNLLDSHPLLTTWHDLVTSPLYYNYTWRPRTIGMTATYRY